MATRADILSYCSTRLQPESYRDVAVNGLQVEGSHNIERLAVAVSTSDLTITNAAEWGADALLVHHGLLWGGQVQALSGVLGRRLKALFQNDINLIAYHLPLDGHPEIGNNALLARELGMTVTGQFGEVAGMPLGVVAETSDEPSLGSILGSIGRLLGREPVAVGDVEATTIQRVAILSGSGYGTLAEAAGLACQVLITGDIREPTMAEARELGIVVVAAGHEATERLGVQALAAELAGQFDLETRFIHDPNPI